MIYIDLRPEPHLYVDARLPVLQALADWHATDRTVRLAAVRQVPTAPTTRLPELRENEGSVTRRGPTAGFNVGLRHGTRRVDFAILNYCTFVGLPVRIAQEWTRGRAILLAYGWRITVDPVADQRAVLERLQQDGGVAITNAGRIERVDGRAFSTRRALDLLECLHYFLWFTKGSSCAPVLPVGFDAAGQRIWAHWNARWVASDRAAYSWLDDAHAGGQLSELFPKFVGVWRNPAYHSALRIGIRYYLDANDANPVQRGIAVAQLVLESCAYAHLVAAGHDPSSFGRHVRMHKTLRRL